MTALSAPRLLGIEHLHALELAHWAVVGLNAEGSVRLFNRGAECMTGFAREEVLGRPFAELLDISDERSSGFSDVHSAGGRDVTLLCSVRTRAGKRREVSWRLARLPKGVDADVVVFAFGHDVTEPPFESAQERERAATVASLCTSLAHEIRNPLNGALLHVMVLERALQRQPIDSECSRALTVIDSELRRLSRLVTEFFEFAQPQPAVRGPVSARALVVHLTGVMANLLERAGIALDVEVQELVIQVDRAKLERALEQLVANGIEASPRGERVSLRVEATGQDVIIEVEDHGRGIPDAALRIFDPFVSTKANGAGLGLAIARRMATDMGGTIVFETKPGRTVFRLTLPGAVSVDIPIT